VVTTIFPCRKARFADARPRSDTICRWIRAKKYWSRFGKAMMYEPGAPLIVPVVAVAAAVPDGGEALYSGGVEKADAGHADTSTPLRAAPPAMNTPP
jgi:hypothetical protein